MGRTVKVMPKRTHATGEGLSKELEKKGRYMVGITLMSLKTAKKRDLIGHSEFYFMSKGDKAKIPSRMPNSGEIQLMMNQSIEFKSDDLTLWSEFVTFKEGEDRQVKVKVQLKEADPGIDSVIAEKEFVIKCPMPTDYFVIESPDKLTEAKVKVYAHKTIF